jgi:arginyl-tRNA synthetase
MHTLEKIKENIAEKINRALGEEIIQASSLVYPPNSEMGDLSVSCFQLVKATRKNPAESASWLMEKLSGKISAISATKTVGPYLNFTINKEFLAEETIKEISKQKEKYGRNKIGGGEKVMIEYSNGNTHKEYHIGHLRNICYGEATKEILLANGYNVMPVSYINDFGIHVAKTLWNYLTNRKEWEGSSENKGYLLGKIYVDANRREKEETTAKQMIQLTMKKIEAREGQEYKLWQETRKWSIDYFDKIYKELGIKFKKIFYESEFIDEGKKMVVGLLEDGILKKSDGAIIADLEKENLGVLVIIRSDGTALYPVADIPLAVEKFKKYKVDKSIYVVDIRQGLYFKQLAFLFNKIGYKQEIIHLGYDIVKLPEGMMSSRSGNVITFKELKEKMFEQSLVETEKRHEDWDEKKIKDAVEKITLGAMKFEMLKVGPDNVITFNIAKALSFEGYTAAYLQYTYARVQSIFRKTQKSKNTKIKFDAKNLIEDKEGELVLKMAKYSESVRRAGENYDPAEIAKYLFELAQMTNDYYHAVPVLKAEEEVKNARLAMLSATCQVLENGLGLLGIEVLEEM